MNSSLDLTPLKVVIAYCVHIFIIFKILTWKSLAIYLLLKTVSFSARLQFSIKKIMKKSSLEKQSYLQNCAFYFPLPFWLQISTSKKNTNSLFRKEHSSISCTS
jgi:hypothetical protein